MWIVIVTDDSNPGGAMMQHDQPFITRLASGVDYNFFLQNYIKKEAFHSKEEKAWLCELRRARTGDPYPVKVML